MGWSAGTFSRVHDWTADEAGSFPNIESARMDQEDDNFATGIDTCLAKDGQNSPSADLPMGGNKHTGVGNAAARDDYVAVNQIQDGDLYVATSVSGTDTIVGTMAPAITAYTNGMRVLFEPAASNTGAATLNLNSVGAQSITKNGTTALAADDLLIGVWADCVYDLSNTNWVLMNPQTTFATAATSVIAGAGMTGGGALTSDVTVNAIAGTGITVNADDIATNDSAIVHDNLSGFVANEHIDHSGVTFTAGAGLTGGGTLEATRDFAVGAGTGIAVNANDVALSHLGIEALTDPAADRLFYWDDSATATNWLTIDNGITIDSDDTMGLTDVAATTTNPVDISSGAVSLDVEALTTIEGSALAATDTFYVEDGGVSKGVEVQAMGMRVQTGQTTQTLAAADMNSIMEFTATSTLTLPLNSSVDLPVGVPIVLNVKHASQELTVTAATSVTLVSYFHPAGGSAASDNVEAGGTALLFKTAADVWCLSGDIVDS